MKLTGNFGAEEYDKYITKCTIMVIVDLIKKKGNPFDDNFSETTQSEE